MFILSYSSKVTWHFGLPRHDGLPQEKKQIWNFWVVDPTCWHSEADFLESLPSPTPPSMKRSGCCRAIDPCIPKVLKRLGKNCLYIWNCIRNSYKWNFSTFVTIFHVINHCILQSDECRAAGFHVNQNSAKLRFMHPNNLDHFYKRRAVMSNQTNSCD